MLADIFVNWPPALVAVIWIGLAVAVTVFLARISHRWILHRHHSELERVGAPQTDGEQVTPAPGERITPTSSELAGHLIRFLGLAFVFMLGFALNNFWGSAKAAESASEAEVGNYLRVVAFARELPTDHGQAQLLAALDAYDQAADSQLPALQHNDAPSAYAAQNAASNDLLEQVVIVGGMGAAEDPMWSGITGSIDDMLTNGRERIDALPSASENRILLVLLILAVANLVMVGVFSPTTFGMTTVISGALAAVLALLLLLVVEASNPYWGAISQTSGLVAMSSGA